VTPSLVCTKRIRPAFKQSEKRIMQSGKLSQILPTIWTLRLRKIYLRLMVRVKAVSFDVSTRVSRTIGVRLGVIKHSLDCFNTFVG
jgi:hypothetical protein